jgi:DNA-binding MarR family transcriptional regulator
MSTKMLDMASSSPPRWLDPEQDRAWRSWLLMSDLLRFQVMHDLQAEAGLSTADFVVLVHLSEATGSRMRMTDLASALRWSKSRLSHQFSRMEIRGLVVREGCSSDARLTYAELTTCGRAVIERAAPIHVESVRRHFIDLLEDGQLAVLSQIGEIVSGHLLAIGTPSDDGAPPCPSLGARAEEDCQVSAQLPVTQAAGDAAGRG